MIVAPLILIAAHLAWASPHLSPGHIRAAAVARSTTCPPTSEPIESMAYYPGYTKNFTLGDVPWHKYTTMIYAFATTTSSSNAIGLEDADVKLLPKFVKEAHDHGVKAMLSIGGWGGSRYFSTAVATDANRTAFAGAVMALVSKYDLDGLNFDWEYPGKQGIGCNIVSANDSANFLSFLQALHAKDGGKNITISAAASITPFVDSKGLPMKDVSSFAEVLDYIVIMNYDVWGSWSPTVGPNAPLNDSCAAPQNQQGSAVSAIKAWTDAGFQPCQLVLGVAAYGHSFHVNRTDAFNNVTGDLNPYPVFNKSMQPAGDKWDSTAIGTDVCGNPNVVGGIFTFQGLIEEGILLDTGTPTNGIYYRFDNCGRTPYVYNATSEVMVSYDDATSFAAKGSYVHDVGLLGFAMWNAAEDYDDILVDAISEGAGISC